MTRTSRVKLVALAALALLLTVPHMALAKLKLPDASAEIAKFTGLQFTPTELVGLFLFFDTTLSEPAGQSCASCHFPGAGFDDPDNDLPVSEGVIPGLFGTRNAPTMPYVAFLPDFGPNPNPFSLTGFQGGFFWDGRAATVADQAKQPFLNPVEMNNANKDEVVQKVSKTFYAGLFEDIWGVGVFDNTETAYDKIAESIAAFEKCQMLRQFNSKYDLFLAGKAKLTPLEEEGRLLFTTNFLNNPDPANTPQANCTFCHAIPNDNSAPHLFTDNDYHNIGVPPLTPATTQDIGLGGRTDIAPPAGGSFNGLFKTPTLRNIALSGPYGHNGFFTSLKEIVHFYNTRDVPEAGWPGPDVPDPITLAPTFLMGNLGLSDNQENAIVAFLETLTDRGLKSLDRLAKHVDNMRHQDEQQNKGSGKGK
ncbi:cytochrome c peroxidase [Desulfocurvibacter africanus]|uniref:cytochrome-c peroxidase n=1 Tax=Desulfocurvibacter africanus TaxID=873 RepID=UPI002FDB157C